MPEIFAMPELAESVVEGEIVRWLKRAGDAVVRDEPFVEIMTEKVTVEIPAPMTGMLLRTAAPEGAVVRVGEPLAVFGIGSDLDDLDALLEAHVSSHLAVPGRAAASGARSANVEVTAEAAVVLAVPAARRAARDLAISLAAVAGSGPNGRIRTRDVLRTAGSREVGTEPPRIIRGTERIARELGPGTCGPERREPLGGVRRVMAHRMREAKAVAAHTLVVEELEMTALIALRASLKPERRRRGIALTLLPFFIRAAGLVLPAHPFLNASLDEAAGELVFHDAVNVGVAVDAEIGLVVPVIRDAHVRSIWEIATTLGVLVQRTRAGDLARSDGAGGTFTISNPGSLGGLFTAPIVNVPEAATLAIHTVAPRPVVRDGEIVVRQMTHLSLAFDHRFVAGAEAVRFLRDLIRLLERPERLIA